MRLFRPVGTEELKLIEESGYKKFPPRLPEQPIFYPVMNVEYATEIAEKWNAKLNSDRKGYVTEFDVEDEFCKRYEVHIVGASHHAELWVPAEELEEFNSNIVGEIRVIKTFE